MTPVCNYFNTVSCYLSLKIKRAGSYPGLPSAAQPGLFLREPSTDPTRSLHPSRPEPARAAGTQRSAGSTASASPPDASAWADAPHLYGRDTEETRRWKNPAERAGCNSRAS